MNGENYVEDYSSVQAYTVQTRDAGIISGGGGEHVVVTEGTRFFWVYNPDGTGGFTGVGWFESTANSPIKVYCDKNSTSITNIIEGFANGTRTDLTDVFTAWQSYVDSNPGQEIVTNFVNTIVGAGGTGCWSSGN